MAVKSALDALDAALANKGVPVSDDTTDEETLPTGDDTSGEGTDDEEIIEGEESGEETGDGAVGDEDADGEGDETSDDETDEEKTERETAEAAAAETPEAKAAREKVEKAESAGTGDILEDPIPKTLGPRGQERMRNLISTVKELQPDADVGRELMQHISNSNMTADEFNMALTFGRLKHSDDVADHRKAYAILWQGLKELAPLVGETLPGVDPLEGHADLQARVIAKTIDPKDAAELAAGRNRRKAEAASTVRASQNAQTASQRAQQNQQLDKAVKQELNELGHRLLDEDKQFEAKMRTMTPAQKAAINATPLGLRVNAFLKTYLTLKAPVRAAAPVAKKPGQQPLRAGKVPAAGGAGVRREAKSAVEAMDFALGLK